MNKNFGKLQEIEQYLEACKQTGMTPEESQELITKMKDIPFIVPVTFQDNETLAAMQAELERTGHSIKMPKDARPIPVLIQNPNKEYYLGVYTSMPQIPKDVKHNGAVEMTFDLCMQYVKNSNSPIAGVVVNPFSHNFIVTMRRERKVTLAQFHVLARKNVEYVLFPHSIYTKGKEYFDSVDSALLFQFFKDQYLDKLPNPYSETDFEVMQLGVSPDLDLIHISMPSAKLEEGGCIRIYVTWHKESGKPGYYMIQKGKEADERKFVYIDENGKSTDLGAAPIESAEMQQVMDLEMDRYRNTNET